MNPLFQKRQIVICLMILCCIALPLTFLEKDKTNIGAEAETYKAKEEKDKTNIGEEVETYKAEEENQTNLLDGCLHVYLDMGTNSGIQIRKVYEASIFPEAKVLPIFDEYFGVSATRKQKVCAVGFELNPIFAKGLQILEAKYRDCGWRVKIFTNTGVTGAGGQNRGFLKGRHDVSGHLSEAEDGMSTDWRGQKVPVKKVDLIRISSFIREIVATRKLPPHKEVPRVLMKLDVEGAELEIVPDLVLTGALAHVDKIMVDWHIFPFQEKNLGISVEKVQKLKDSITLLQDLASENGLGEEVGRLEDIDDETYGNFKKNSVSCSS